MKHGMNKGTTTSLGVRHFGVQPQGEGASILSALHQYRRQRFEYAQEDAETRKQPSSISIVLGPVLSSLCSFSCDIMYLGGLTDFFLQSSSWLQDQIPLRRGQQSNGNNIDWDSVRYFWHCGDHARDILAELITSNKGEYVLQMGSRPPHATLFAGESLQGSVGWRGKPRTTSELHQLCEVVTRTVEELGGKVRARVHLWQHVVSDSAKRCPPCTLIQSTVTELRCCYDYHPQVSPPPPKCGVPW